MVRKNVNVEARVADRPPRTRLRRAGRVIGWLVAAFAFVGGLASVWSMARFPAALAQAPVTAQARVTDSFINGFGGDPAVNDITHGGLRWLHDSSKANLAPAVQPYFYRLICTNGMEMFDPLLKIDARGGTVDSMLEALEVSARRAFERVERDITHFYALRELKVENPERTLRRMALEGGLSERLSRSLLDAVPSMLGNVRSTFPRSSLSAWRRAASASWTS